MRERRKQRHKWKIRYDSGPIDNESDDSDRSF